MNLLVSPHQDDETLFAAYTCLRFRPLVVVVLRSVIEEGWDPPVTFQQRELEAASATRILGCDYEQWDFPDNEINWAAVNRKLALYSPDKVFAPLPEENGHQHHNAIGELARKLWPQTRFYSTYSYPHGPGSAEKTTVGVKVRPEPGWDELKRRAMGCYVSQASHPNTHLPFDTWPVDEYLS